MDRRKGPCSTLFYIIIAIIGLVVALAASFIRNGIVCN
jgi:hypothetical protein